MLDRRSLAIMVGAAALVAGCTPSEEAQTGNDLRSDIPLRSVDYFVAHEDEAAEMRGVCDRWKASQRPIGSWPSVVTTNCNNVGLAANRKLNNRENDKLKKQMGI
jgi:hypothetical protein